MRHLLVMAALLLIQPTPPPQVVTVSGADDLLLYADYYAPLNRGAPGVLLLHQLYTTRASWVPLAAELHAEGYAVLAPDLRGYGATGGAINWTEAQRDTRIWLHWLREQPDVDNGRAAIVGSSMGANLAVIGCSAGGPTCATAVAISPGLNYFGYTPLAPALDAATQPHLLISSQRDGYPARATRELSASYPAVEVLWLEGNAHGMALLDEKTTAEITAWLGVYLP